MMETRMERVIVDEGSARSLHFSGCSLIPCSLRIQGGGGHQIEPFSVLLSFSVCVCVF